MGYSDKDFTAIRQLSESKVNNEEYKKADNSDLNKLLELATGKRKSLGVGCSRCDGVFEVYGDDKFHNHKCNSAHSLSFFDFIKRLFK